LRSQQETVEPRFLLETKFYPPRLPRDLVPRPRLRDSLVRGTTSKLMLASAPAGRDGRFCRATDERISSPGRQSAGKIALAT
jgi:hypothetical protein